MELSLHARRGWEHERFLMINSTIKRSFLLEDGENFEEKEDVWSYNDEVLKLKKKKDRVNLSDCNTGGEKLM